MENCPAIISVSYSKLLINHLPAMRVVRALVVCNVPFVFNLIAYPPLLANQIICRHTAHTAHRTKPDEMCCFFSRAIQSKSNESLNHRISLIGICSGCFLSRSCCLCELERLGFWEITHKQYELLNCDILLASLFRSCYVYRGATNHVYVRATHTNIRVNIAIAEPTKKKKQQIVRWSP